MRNLTLCGLFLALAVPAFAQPVTLQQTAPAPAAGPATDADTAQLNAMRDKLASENKQLTDEVNSQRAILKKNQDMLKSAQQLDAANKKLEAEKVRLEAQNQQLEAQRKALNAMQANSAPAATPAPDAAPAK